MLHVCISHCRIENCLNKDCMTYKEFEELSIHVAHDWNKHNCHQSASNLSFYSQTSDHVENVPASQYCSGYVYSFYFKVYIAFV